MAKKNGTTALKATDIDAIQPLLERYGCGPIQFSGTDEALYERHLLFDDVVDPAEAGPREKFEAMARSVKNVLSQRWVRTEQTYKQANPKRIYYISMEFLIGRSLANNVTNLLLDPVAKDLVEKKNLDLLGLLEQEPDAGLGNGGLGGWRPAFSTRWRRWSCRPWATGYATSTEFSGSRSRTGGSSSGPTTGCATRIRGR
jgi:hypothetical protein